MTSSRVIVSGADFTVGWTQFSIRDFDGNYLRRMVRPERFELPTFWFVGFYL